MDIRVVLLVAIFALAMAIRPSSANAHHSGGGGGGSSGGGGHGGGGGGSRGGGGGGGHGGGSGGGWGGGDGSGGGGGGHSFWSWPFHGSSAPERPSSPAPLPHIEPPSPPSIQNNPPAHI